MNTTTLLKDMLTTEYPMEHIIISLKIDEEYVGIIYELTPEGFEELIKSDKGYKPLKSMPLSEEAYAVDEWYIYKTSEGGVYIMEDWWYEDLDELARRCKKLYKLENKINNKLQEITQ